MKTDSLCSVTGIRVISTSEKEGRITYQATSSSGKLLAVKIIAYNRHEDLDFGVLRNYFEMVQPNNGALVGISNITTVPRTHGPGRLLLFAAPLLDRHSFADYIAHAQRLRVCLFSRLDSKRSTFTFSSRTWYSC